MTKPPPLCSRMRFFDVGTQQCLTGFVFNGPKGMCDAGFVASVPMRTSLLCGSTFEVFELVQGGLSRRRNPPIVIGEWCFAGCRRGGLPAPGHFCRARGHCCRSNGHHLPGNGCRARSRRGLIDSARPSHHRCDSASSSHPTFAARLLHHAIHS